MREEVNHAHLYGLKVRSCWPLPSAPPEARVLHELDLRLSTVDALRARALRAPKIIEKTKWFSCRHDLDGTVHLSWTDLVEASIDAEGGIAHLAGSGSSGPACVRNYLFAQLLSFPLLHRGLDALHGAVVMTPAGCLALLGDSGVGKSTLTMALLHAGARVVTDDLLVFLPTDEAVNVMAGPPRIRLLPASAARLLPAGMSSQPMNARTTKRVYELPADWHASQPAPLRAIYVLQRAGTNGTLLEVEPVHAIASLRLLLRHAFNPYDRSARRLSRQLESYSALVRRVPVRRLRVRRRFRDLSLVADRLLEDLATLARPYA